MRGRRGQPATPLFLDFSGAYSIGCEISWRHIDITLINLGSQQIGHYRRHYDWPDATTIVAEAAGAITSLVDKLDPSQRARLVGLGLASPTEIGLSVSLVGAPAEQVELWKRLDLRTRLEAATGLPTAWFNDGNSACWAQMVMSPPPRPANFTHLFVSTFLGAGITAEHTLWEGPSGNSANLGSMLVTTGDGRQTLGHEIASTTALVRRLVAAGIDAPAGDPQDWPWQEWEPHVQSWVADSGAAMAEILFNTGAVIEVEVAVIDGIVPAPIVDRLVEATASALATLPAPGITLPRLVAGHLGAGAVALGAAQLPLFRRHFSRDLHDMLGDDS